MPKLKGRIKPEDLCRITQNYQVILDDFDPNDGLLDYVFSKEIFTSHEVDIVKNDGANTSKGRSERFIDILTKSDAISCAELIIATLPTALLLNWTSGTLQNAFKLSYATFHLTTKRGPDAYQHFIDGLMYYGYEHIAQQLQETDVSDGKFSDPLKWVDELPEKMHTVRVMDKDCSRLAPAFGIGWDAVMFELGLTKIVMDQIKMTEHSNVNVVARLLIHWRQKFGKTAVWGSLLTAMVNVHKEGRCEIDWDTVKKTVTATEQWSSS